MTWNLFGAWLETIEILSDSDLMEQIRESMKETEKEKTHLWEEVKGELDL